MTDNKLLRLRADCLAARDRGTMLRNAASKDDIAIYWNACVETLGTVLLKIDRLLIEPAQAEEPKL